jgi:L-asparaginase / beta-aspartyl-peptidase
MCVLDWAGMTEFAIAIHGGAGVISKDQTDPNPFYNALRRIIQRTTQFAQESKEILEISAVDVAEFCSITRRWGTIYCWKRIRIDADETHELEASVMNGSNLECGAVSLLRTKKVMENTEHI